jgi:hypothetical protein
MTAHFLSVAFETCGITEAVHATCHLLQFPSPTTSKKNATVAASSTLASPSQLAASVTRTA